jgi:polysaccharide export outer membrane protein
MREVTCAIAILFSFAGALHAQTDEYVVGIGDVLRVNVWQRADLSGDVIVDSEGNITLPLLGSVLARGITPRRLGIELTRRFSLVDRGVSQVTVSVTQYNSRRVFVMGEVMSPGSYAFAQIPGLWDVIREAGGPTPVGALSRVRIIPPEGKGAPSTVNLETAIATGDFQGLPVIEPGSTIRIPHGEVFIPEGDFINVYGSVRAPGLFPIESARSVLQAILAAGGPLESADLEQVRVVRPSPVQARVFEINLDDYTHDGVLSANMSLLPGDTVTVPDLRRQSFFGKVRGFAEGAGGFMLSAAALILAASK